MEPDSTPVSWLLDCQIARVESPAENSARTAVGLQREIGQTSSVIKDGQSSRRNGFGNVSLVPFFRAQVHPSHTGVGVTTADQPIVTRNLRVLPSLVCRLGRGGARGVVLGSG